MSVLWLRAGGPSPSSEATSAAKALPRRSQRPARGLHGGPVIGGCGRAPALDVPWRTRRLLGSRHPLCWEAAYFLFSVQTPPLFLTFNNNYAGSSSPPGKMRIAFFSRDVDVFFQPPRALTQAHESHFQRGESLGSRLDKTEVPTQGWALAWLCDCGGVAQPL